ncbi:hypothetical protein H6F67_21380 [Microcoleus sp. FACHB-1515]|nr:hypothetical protein [Microcoleus sp. FACHB-1515]MBD2092406.1 hypothetical protein [Microcoleus sp. FACHB-1515]
MKPRIHVCLSIDIENAVTLDPNKPEELEENVRILCDLLNDLKALLIRQI